MTTDSWCMEDEVELLELILFYCFFSYRSEGFELLVTCVVFVNVK